MDQPRLGGKVNRRRFLKTAAGTTAGAALTAWSLKHPAPARAAVADRARAAEPNPKRGGVLKWAGPAEVAHFDVHQGAFRFVLGQMYNNLVRFNPADGLKTIIPDLAESWKISPDGKTYTFKLRDGVKFHDGTAFSSADVVATFSRIIFPPAGMASIYKDQFAAVAKVEAIDRLNVRFVLKEPQPYFLELFTPSSMIVYSKKALDENNQDLRKVIAPGTGAFMFKERKVAEKWVMVRNPSYWDPEIPYLDGIELLHIPAWTDRGTAVLTGQADYSPNVSLETHAEGIKRKDIVGTVRYPGEFNSYQVHINNERKPFNDPRVRRAINLAVSRQNLIKAFGTQEPIVLTRWMTHASEFATPLKELETLPGYRADKTADLAEAKKLMAAAGVADGDQERRLRVGLGRAPRRDPGARLPGRAAAHARHRDQDPRDGAGAPHRGAEEGHLRHDGADGVPLAHRRSRAGLGDVPEDGRLAQLLALLQPRVRQAAEADQQRDEQGQAQAALRAGHGAAGPDGAALPHRVHRPPADVAQHRQGPQQRSPGLLGAGSRGHVLAGPIAAAGR